MALPTETDHRRSRPGDPAGSAGAPRDVGESLPRLVLPRPMREQLERRASDGYPHEVCGLLIGTLDGTVTRIERVTDARNTATERLADRYTLHPDDFLAADLEARRGGLDVVGVWHTHPDHPARPSATDLAAAWDGYTYLILSVRREGVTDLTAWRLAEGSFVEQPVEEA